MEEKVTYTNNYNMDSLLPNFFLLNKTDLLNQFITKWFLLVAVTVWNKERLRSRGQKSLLTEEGNHSYLGESF